MRRIATLDIASMSEGWEDQFSEVEADDMKLVDSYWWSRVYTVQYSDTDDTVAYLVPKEVTHKTLTLEGLTPDKEKDGQEAVWLCHIAARLKEKGCEPFGNYLKENASSFRDDN